MLTFSFFTLSQTTPSVRVKANEFNHYPSIPTKDWIWSVFEDDEGSFISAGYTNIIIGSVATSIHPTLVKVDKDLESVWHQVYTSGEVLNGFIRNFKWAQDAGTMQDAIQYTGSDNKIYYVAVGHTYLTGQGCPEPGDTTPIDGTRLIIVKTDRDGNVVSGFPRIYMNTPGLNDTALCYGFRTGRAIVYDKTDPGYFYIAGSENNVPCIFRLNENLDISSLTKLVTLPTGKLLGELLSICLGYPDGSNPKGNPITTSQTPTHVWATGLGRNHTGPPSNIYFDSSILITKVEINSGSSSFTNPQTIFEDAPAPPANVWETGGSPWGRHTASWYEHFKNIGNTTCLASFKNRTGGDVGTGIRQLNNGNIIVTGLANLIYRAYYGNTFCVLPPSGEYWRDSDAFARLIKQEKFPQIGVYVNSSSIGYEIDCQHIGHLSGMEYIPKVRQDEVGNLYFSGSNGDPLTTQKDTLTGIPLRENLYVIKTTAALTPLWNQTYRSEVANEFSCGFALDICQNGELVVAGDNKKEKDNYDFIKLGNCETSYTAYSPDMISAHADGVTISVYSQLLGGAGTYNITTDKKIKGRLVIENGCTVNVSNGAELQFADMDRLNSYAVNNGFEYGVVIKPGGKLQLVNGAILTSLSGCEHKWRGVQVQAGNAPDQTNASTIGILEMTDSKIKNAICGVTVDGGGLITCTNTATATNNPAGYDMVNFLNNRKGVAFFPFGTNNLSRFNFTNFSFESPDAVKDFEGIGLNTHCSMYGVEKIIFNGCSFVNTYTGPYRIGIGLASFDATFMVLRGNDDIDGEPECPYPSGKVPLFQNLVYGILTDGTPISSPTSPANFIGVGEAEFKNCGMSWECDNANSPFAYKNYFYWDDDLGTYDMPVTFANSGFGMELNETLNPKIHENTFEVDEDYTNGFGLRVLNNYSTSFPSLLRANKFTHLNPSSTSSSLDGVFTAGDNSELDLKCNEFNYLTNYDWANTGAMKDQGTSSFAPGNVFSDPNPGYNILNVGSSFEYQFNRDPSLPPAITNIVIGIPTPFQQNEDCYPLTACQVYIPDILGQTFVFEFENIEAPAMQIKDEIWKKIKEANYPAAQNLTNSMEAGSYKSLFITVIPILQSRRLLKPTPNEVQILTILAKTENEASIDAFHFLSFFMEIPVYKVKTESLIRKEKTNVSKELKTKQTEIKEKGFMIYPNPTSGLLYLELNNMAQPCTFEILDVTGHLILSYKNIKPGERLVIDLKSKSMGVYMYKLYSDDYLKTGKIILSQ